MPLFWIREGLGKRAKKTKKFKIEQKTVFFLNLVYCVQKGFGV